MGREEEPQRHAAQAPRCRRPGAGSGGGGGGGGGGGNGDRVGGQEGDVLEGRRGGGEGLSECACPRLRLCISESLCVGTRISATARQGAGVTVRRHVSRQTEAATATTPPPA